MLPLKKTKMYSLLPFQFKEIQNRILLTNIVGNYIFLGHDEFSKFIDYQLTKKHETYLDLKAKFFLYNPTNKIEVIKLLASKYYTKKRFIEDFTVLHMIVPTLNCDSNCLYCQVSSTSKDNNRIMTKATAKKITQTIFECPSKSIKIEFQGGEPLLNFPIVKHIVLLSEILKKLYRKNVDYVICTNLINVTDDQLDFLKKYNVHISTSLDGTEAIHDAMRKLRDGTGSYNKFKMNLLKAQKLLGNNNVSALMTTTKVSLLQFKEIINEYIDSGFNSIFLRSINPFGGAKKNKNDIDYSAEDFCKFYIDALEYIIELNSNGIFFVEEFATILLRKILTPFSTGFIDLQSPSGLGISGALYNYDGKVYASDEGRMLAEMGDDKFLIGDTTKNNYHSIFHNEKLIDMVDGTILYGFAPCNDCVYVEYCGIDPVKNYINNVSFDINACKRNKTILDYIFHKILNSVKALDIFWSWICKNKKSLDMTYD